MRRQILSTMYNNTNNVSVKTVPFYRYGGHIEFIRVKEYYRMPRGHEHDPIYSLSICTRAFWANFSLSFPWKRLQWEEKIVVPCLDVIMNAFFLRNIQWSSHFARKARVNTEQVPPGHPIILLKSYEFNMAAVSVERSIENLTTEKSRTPGGYSPLKVTRVLVGKFREHPQKGAFVWKMGVLWMRLQQNLCFRQHANHSWPLVLMRSAGDEGE